VSRVRIPAEVACFSRSGERVGWVPCFVEMTVHERGLITDAHVSTAVEKRVEEQADELASIRDRAGKIASMLVDVAAELRRLSDGMSPEESARVLDQIERSLGIAGSDT